MRALLCIALSAILVSCVSHSFHQRPLGTFSMRGSYPAQNECEVPLRPLNPVGREELNVRYARIGGEDLKADLYWPVHRAHPPIVLLIHGGGWVSGGKEDLIDSARTFATLGYAAVTLNYRLARADRNKAPASIQDLRCALRWIKTEAPNYGWDERRVAAVGVSAGAHLAAMLATAPTEPSLDSPDCTYRDAEAKLTSMVGYFGPYDLQSSKGVPPKSMSILTNFLGSTPEQNPRLAYLVSPQPHVNEQSAPIFLIHGGGDRMVPSASSRAMADTLERNERPYGYIEIDGADHGFEIFEAGSPYKPGICSMLSFLQETLSPH